MTDQKSSPNGDSDPRTPAELRFGGSWKMIIPFALLPLAIVAGATVVFFLFGKIAGRERSATEYLAELQSGSSHKRWQAAYELSRYIARGNVEKKAAFESEMIDIYRGAKPDEQRLRRYLLVGLAQIGSEKSVDLLLSELQTKLDSESEIFTLWALGRLGNPKAAPALLQRTHADDAGLRKTAAFSLGFVGDHTHRARLKALLNDNINDVRWNAALALAQLGSAAGKRELLFLLDRPALRKATPNLRDAERTLIMISALNAVGRLKLQDAKMAIAQLTDHDADSVLRQTAQNILRVLNGEG